MSNPFQNLNPLAIGMKKLLFDLLKDKYPEHEEMISRLATVVVTEKDYSAVTKMLIDIYYKGFSQAVEAQRDQLEKLGYKVQVYHGSNSGPTPKIFNQQNVVDDQK
jgi:hypothetical protein